MVIVLTASFIVLATIGVGAALVVKNIDQVSGGGSVGKAISNMQSAIERVHGSVAVSGSAYGACAQDDCINTSNASCGPCASTIIDLGNNNFHTVEITSLTQPTADPAVGSMTILATGVYKAVRKSKSVTMCLNYCAISGRNCDSDGCGGICGTCIALQTCGAVTPGVCGSATSCSDPTIECGDECVEGDTCGGGTVVDATNNIIATFGGCQNENGDGCSSAGNTDGLTKTWDNASSGTTGATDMNDGRTNAETLRTFGGGLTIGASFEAVKFCDDLIINGSFDTWYLPAYTELNNLYTASSNGWTSGYVADNYWASDETNVKEANFFNFSGAVGVGNISKDQSLYIRCLRRY